MFTANPQGCHACATLFSYLPVTRAEPKGPKGPKGPRGYNRYFGGPRGPGVVRNRVNLSFLSTALDPQADVILPQNYKLSCPFFVFIKIGFLVKNVKNQVLGWFWDDLSLKFGFCVKNWYRDISSNQYFTTF